MIEGIEVQVISRILTSEDSAEIDVLMGYDLSYYSAYLDEMTYIHNHQMKYNIIPSRFDFQLQFPDFVVVSVTEPLSYLEDKLRENKKYIILNETFNKMKSFGQGDIDGAWKYLEMQCDKASNLENQTPMNIIKDAEKRADQIVAYSKQKRIPTGFAEIDKLMYGGLSTVEELCVIIARTNSGKTWVCTRMMESAQKNGFPVAYYSPEMQSAFLGTRFDTWRGHFENSSLFLGKYSEEYLKYIHNLPQDETDAFIIEDKDFPDGVSVRTLNPFVKKHGIKLLIIDGISYMVDDLKASRDQEKFKNIAMGLFQLSKKYGCAVVLVMQANREVKNKVDDKGDNIPDLYNAEGSDQPARIATQAFGIRQVFDKHILDIKLLKSRNANNQNPIVSYSWDVNTGKVQQVQSDSDSSTQSSTISAPTSITPILSTSIQPDTSDLALIDDDDDGGELEF